MIRTGYSPKPAVRPEWFLVGIVDATIVGVVMADTTGTRRSTTSVLPGIKARYAQELIYMAGIACARRMS